MGCCSTTRRCKCWRREYLPSSALGSAPPLPQRTLGSKRCPAPAAISCCFLLSPLFLSVLTERGSSTALRGSESLVVDAGGSVIVVWSRSRRWGRSPTPGCVLLRRCNECPQSRAGPRPRLSASDNPGRKRFCWSSALCLCCITLFFPPLSQQRQEAAQMAWAYLGG